MKKNIFILVVITCSFANAQQENSVSSEPGLIESSRDIKGKPYPEYDDKNDNHRQWEWALPFLAQKVIDRGFNLPRPYGLSIVYTTIQQNVALSDLEVTFDPSKPLKDINFVDLSNSSSNNDTWQLKLDAWILPFLNMYALFGTVEGTGSVNVALNAKEFFDDVDTSICSGGIIPDFCNGYVSANAPMKYHGYNYGIGVLVATAYKDYFFAMPLSYVITDLNVSTSNQQTFNAIPRFGYNIQTAHSGKYGLYLGGNYLQSHADLTGTFVLPMASSPIGHDVNLQYKIHEHPQDIWNAIAGVNWEMSDRWSAVLEIGASDHRRMQTFIFNYRF
jgi:hypothetical protein